MKPTWLGAVLIFGFGLPLMCCLTLPTPPCLSAVELCMSDLCLAKTAGSFCEGNAEGCQIKEWVVCNRSLTSVLELFPSLRVCVCEQDTVMCGSIPELLTQCHQKPARQLKGSENDWQSSTLLDLVHDTSGACLESIKLCLGDTVCNRRLAPVLQACLEPNCERDRCQQVTTTFFQAMPPSVARMMVMCHCLDTDETCQRMSSALHSGTCGTEKTNCLHTVTQCARDKGCRTQLSAFQSQCWSFVDPHCKTNPHTEECLSQMKPAFILAAQPECQAAFLGTVSTALHHPCTCEGLLGPDLQTCAMIHQVFHNRTHFTKQRKDSDASTKPPAQSEDVLFELSDYLLSGVACLLLTGIAVLAISVILWLARRRRENKLHSFQKSHTVIL
ncbi:hypothetical protein WMY93_018906 [Mugilogobius chulae]|uniref:GDNF/GAS1 domain-containing protein n=1 Tax=Mugilogobius chulae TaxID=88201 RepID=A0AAW0NW71_9GOBI